MKQVIALTLPAHWACALINHDKSGLGDQELADITFTGAVHGLDLFTALSCSDVAIVTRYHDARGSAQGKVCECLEYSYFEHAPL